FWSSQPEFGNIIKKFWSKRSSDTPFNRLYGKLQGLKRELKKLNDAKFSNISQRVKDKRAELESIQGCLFQNPNAANVDRARNCRMEVENLEKDEEIFLRSKSRALWIVEGDKNSKFSSIRSDLGI
ncbi:hypothetical protein LINPERHAP2_LOCUS19390, partial [Linum perenne]